MLEICSLVVNQCPGLAEKLEEFESQGVEEIGIASSKPQVAHAVLEMESIAKLIGHGLLSSDHYIDLGALSREGREVYHGEHYYSILAQIRKGAKREWDLLVMFQKIPRGQDTGSEVHLSGVETFMPLGAWNVYEVNGIKYRPDPYIGLLAVLPGDLHHHINTQTPAWSLIVAGFGFSDGIKTDQRRGAIPEFYTLDRDRRLR